MNIFTRGPWMRVVAVLAIVSISSLSCNDESSTEPEASDAPEVPPQATFLMDFSDFASSGMAPLIPGAATPAESMIKVNWGFAAGNVVLWNTLITVGLAVPVATFVESFNHEPELQEDGSWRWAYDVSVGSQVYSAALYGRLGMTGTTWQMYVSKEGDFQDFLWYTGEADLLLTHGSWRLYKSPEEPHELLDITWNLGQVSGTGDIKYTNIEPDGPENGGYIFYGITMEDPYNAFYDIYNIGDDNHTDIEWHRTNKDGRVRDFNHFNDDEWHCWDSDLEDTDCP